MAEASEFPTRPEGDVIRIHVEAANVGAALFGPERHHWHKAYVNGISDLGLNGAIPGSVHTPAKDWEHNEKMIVVQRVMADVKADRRRSDLVAPIVNSHARPSLGGVVRACGLDMAKMGMRADFVFAWHIVKEFCRRGPHGRVRSRCCLSNLYYQPPPKVWRMFLVCFCRHAA